MEFMEKSNPIFSIIKGIIISFLITIIALIIFSALLVYTELAEETIQPVIITITGISILVGSSLATRNLKKNGLINGGIIGFIYILIIYLISSSSNADFSLNLSSIIMIGIGLVGGLLGRNNWYKYK